MIKLTCIVLVLLTYDSKAIEFDYSYDSSPLILETTPSASTSAPLTTGTSMTTRASGHQDIGVDLFKNLKGILKVMKLSLAEKYCFCH